MTWKLDYEALSLLLKKPFTIATGSSTERPTIIVRLADGEGHLGLGEATPVRYLGETPETSAQGLSGMAAWVRDEAGWLESRLQAAGTGSCASILEEIDVALRARFPEARSTLTGVNTALHDLLGKRLERDIATLLDLPRGTGPASSYTIDIEGLEGRLAQVREARALGMDVLKVKLGAAEGPPDDEVLQAIRELHQGPLCVDANGGWTEQEAVERIRRIERFALEFVEQPIPRGDPAAMGRIREAVNIPLMADEDSLDMRDLPGLRGHVDGINIKLAKCGGLTEALRMIRFASQEGWKIMAGCMIESSITITAASWLLPLLDYADLDAALLLAHDPFQGAVMENGRLIQPSGPGLGVAAR